MGKCILAILDGYAIAEKSSANAITSSKQPNLDNLFEKYPNITLECSGLEVGLPKGQMGNSEVGHLNIGSGRVVYQDLTKISKSIDDGDFFENKALSAAMDRLDGTNNSLHVIGLLSDGGVHSAQKHYLAIADMAKRKNVKNLYYHCFTDGRDTYRQSAEGYVGVLAEKLNENKLGEISSIIGRFYAMDRDNRFERVEKAYNAMIGSSGLEFSKFEDAIGCAYNNEVYDEFIETSILSNGENIMTSRVSDGDSIIFFNFRADRAREITKAFVMDDFDGFKRKKINDLHFVCMTEYESSITGVDIAFPPKDIKNTLGEVLSDSNVKQLRIAETEKYAHVTYFFNGGLERPFENEDRVLIPSPKVATYDLKPSMSAVEITDELISKTNENNYEFVLVNYANCDMVGHTGVFDAAVEAVETVDVCVSRLKDFAKEKGYTLLITADHGNCEQMMFEGKVYTAHTTNPVPFIVVSDEYEINEGRFALKDIAPTVLKILGINKPAEMLGESIIK